MADVLTLGQQQISSSALSGPIEISGTFQQQLVPNVRIQHLILLLNRQRKTLLLLNLLYQSGKSVPLHLVTSFIAGGD